MTTRLSVLVNEDVDAALDDLSRKREVPENEIVRRAVSLCKFLEDAIAEGYKIVLVDDDGTEHMLVPRPQ